MSVTVKLAAPGPTLFGFVVAATPRPPVVTMFMMAARHLTAVHLPAFVQLCSTRPPTLHPLGRNVQARPALRGDALMDLQGGGAAAAQRLGPGSFRSPTAVRGWAGPWANTALCVVDFLILCLLRHRYCPGSPHNLRILRDKSQFPCQLTCCALQPPACLIAQAVAALRSAAAALLQLATSRSTRSGAASTPRSRRHPTAAASTMTAAA